MPKKTTDLPLLDTAAAAQLIADGGILAYPTEGVFGIGCDPSNPEAIQKLLATKARDPAKGLILIAASLQQLSPWTVQLSSEQMTRIGDSWPGPVTWILPASVQVPASISGGRPTVAARVTAHAPVVALCTAAQTAIISTSANLSGHSPARHLEQLHGLTGVDGILDAPVGLLKGPTPIFNLFDGTQIRP